MHSYVFKNNVIIFNQYYNKVIDKHDIKKEFIIKVDKHYKNEKENS